MLKQQSNFHKVLRWTRGGHEKMPTLEMISFKMFKFIYIFKTIFFSRPLVRILSCKYYRDQAKSKPTSLLTRLCSIKGCNWQDYNGDLINIWDKDTFFLKMKEKTKYILGG